MYGEIVLDKGEWFLVKWYRDPMVLCKYYRGTKEAAKALYRITITTINLKRRAK